MPDPKAEPKPETKADPKALERDYSALAKPGARLRYARLTEATMLPFGAKEEFSLLKKRGSSVLHCRELIITPGFLVVVPTSEERERRNSISPDGHSDPEVLSEKYPEEFLVPWSRVGCVVPK